MAVKLDLDTLDHLLGVGDDAAFKGIPSLKPAQDAASSFVTGVSSPEHHAATAPKPIAPPAASTPPKFFTGPQPIGTSAAPTSMPTLNPAVNSTAHPAAQPAPTSMPAIAPMGGSPEVAPMMTPMGAQGPSKPPESAWQKIAHGLGVAADIAAPRIAPRIPGTPMHEEAEEARKSALAKQGAESSLETAQAGAVPSEIALRQAQTEAAKDPGAADAAKKKAELGAESDFRADEAKKAGLKPGTPEYQRYLATGQMAAEQPGKTPSEQVYASDIAAGKTPQEAFADSTVKQPSAGDDFEKFYKDYLTDNKFPDTAHNRLLARQQYSTASQAPQRPQQQLLVTTDKNGVQHVLEARPGMTIDPNAETFSARNPSGQAKSREEQAAVIARAGDGLIKDIQSNRGKIGNVKAIVESAFLGTPLADPSQAGLATEIASFAALQPAMHGMRGLDALKAFEKIIGGIPDNPDALISSIKAIQKTAGYFNPNQATSGGGNGGGRQSVKDWMANRNK